MKPLVARRATARDVAQLAGVSRATVSYVLNEVTTQSIPEATRERVRRAARALDYVPNGTARALKQGRSNLVLLVVRDVRYGRNLGDLVEAMATEAAARGLCLVTWQASQQQTLADALRHLQPALVLGILPLHANEVAALQRAHVPFSPQAPWGRMGLDDVITARQVQRLAEQGHRRVGYVGTTDDSLGPFAAPRRQGVRRACLELGLDAPVEVELASTGEDCLPELERTLLAWQALPEPVTAVACYNDFHAAAVLTAARRAGIRVGPRPDEGLAVIGIDNELLALHTDPPLTTIAVDMAAMARHQIDWGVRALTGSTDPGPGHLPSEYVQLVPRGTA